MISNTPINPEQNIPKIEENLSNEVVEQNVEMTSQNLAAENIPQNIQPVQPVDLPVDVPQDQAAEPTESEITEEFSETVQSSDKPWVQKVGEVIKDLSDQPYQEEEAAEDLQIDYMKQRFGVNIEKKEHQK